MRLQLFEVLGHVAHAQVGMDGLKATIVDEMTEGYRPTYRGHPWTPAFFTVLEAASSSVEASFHLMKWLQFPETQSHRQPAAATVLRSAYADISTLPPILSATREPQRSERKLWQSPSL